MTTLFFVCMASYHADNLTPGDPCLSYALSRLKKVSLLLVVVGLAVGLLRAVCWDTSLH